MNKFFNIKRTKMTDDAAFRHNPVNAGKIILTFILVYFVAGFFSALIPTIVESVYNLIIASKNGLLDAYVSAAQSGDATAVEAVLNELMESIVAPWWIVAVELFATLLIAGCVIFYCLKMEKRPFKSLGLRGGKGAAFESLLGFLVGIAITLLAIGFSFATGSISFVYNEPFIGFFVLLIPACLISAISDELLWRGYLMTSLARDTTPMRAILIMSIVYAVFHISLNPILILNSFLFAFFMGTYVFKRGSIWGASFIGFVWKYLSAIIFGSTIPGVRQAPSILKPVFVRLDAISGGELFGFFAGLSMTLVLVIAISILLLTNTKRKEISDFTIDYFA